MSWSLSASGHTTEQEERQLARKLGDVLREAGQAVSNVSFSGQHVRGDIREPESSSGA